MNIQTKFHGTVELHDTDVLLIDRPPLLGFSHLSRFLLLPHAQDSPFLYLQSAENPRICFVVVDPLVWVSDYAIPEEDITDLGSRDDWAALTVCTIDPQGGQVTANLRSPLVINKTTRRGGQFVLSVPYPHQFPLMQQEDSHAGLNQKVR